MNELINKYPVKDANGKDIKDPTVCLWNMTDIYNKKKIELEKLNLKHEELKNTVEKLKIEHEENYYIIPKEGEDLRDKLYWNRTVFEAPDQLNFWFDFLDTQGEL
jgi:hypothetical protein